MNVYTAEQMKTADQQAVSAGIPSQLLMETAGQKIAQSLLERYPRANNIMIICGKGNNGGDGYVAARYLHTAGKHVQLLEFSSSPSTDDARVARQALVAQGLFPVVLQADSVDAWFKNADVIVDAIFGSGLNRPVSGDYLRVIEALNRQSKPVVSVDIPSGLMANEARADHVHVNAAFTLQLAGPKLASVLEPARTSFGEWQVADIGIPEGILNALSSLRYATPEYVRTLLPARAANAHKYTAGTVLVLAGSPRYLGAAELACRAAYRAGAGLVTLVAEERLAGSWPEIIFEAFQWTDAALKTLSQLDDKRAQVRLLGPGLGENAYPYLADVLRLSNAPTVLDAGALQADDALKQAIQTHGRCVLTPHIGEAARLLNNSSSEVSNHPVDAAMTLAATYNAVIVLKGATTVVAAPDGRVAVSTSGHAGMATGGSGDVLSGMIAAWLANSDALFERSLAAVYTHGLAGEYAAKQYGYGLVASDIIASFSSAWLALS